MGMNESTWVRFILPDFRGEIHLFAFLEVPVGNGDAHLLWVPDIHRGLANLAGCGGILCPSGAQL